MIDLHCHILPCIDDGSSSLDESLKMIDNAIKCGISDIIVTPHYIEDSKYNVDTIKRNEILEELKGYVKNENINLYIGNEVYFKKNVSSLLGSVSTLNNSRYILIEFPVNFMPNNIFNELHELIIKDYKIIIAHPERYTFFQDDIHLMEKFIDKGILFQGNVGSLFGTYSKSAKKALKKMIKYNLIHFLASDSHKEDDKKFYYFTKLNKVLKKSVIEELTYTNPNLVIENKDIVIKKYKKRRFGIKKI